MIEQKNHGAQSKNRANTVGRNTSLNDTNNLTKIISPQTDMHTIEKNIVSKVRSEVASAMTTVETRVQDKVMTAMEKMVNLRVEIATNSVNTSSGRGVGIVALEPDQRELSGNFEGLQMTTSSKINSYTDLNIIDETHGKTTVEGVDLTVNEKNIDRQTHNHHNLTSSPSFFCIKTNLWKVI